MHAPQKSAVNNTYFKESMVMNNLEGNSLFGKLGGRTDIGLRCQIAPGQ